VDDPIRSAGLWPGRSSLLRQYDPCPTKLPSGVEDALWNTFIDPSSAAPGNVCCRRFPSRC
jgi:hypothetical protein